MFRLFVLISSFLVSEAAFAVDMNDLFLKCAPDVHPQTMWSIVSHESQGNYLVISDDDDLKLPEKNRVLRAFYPSSIDEAVSTAESLIKSGHVIGIGLGQLSNRHLKRLNLSLRDAFEPCTNIWGASRVLVEFYTAASQKYGPGQAALYAAISAYNTGSYIKGFKNGYVKKVIQAGQRVPNINIGTEAQRKKVSVSSKSKSSVIKPKIKNNDLVEAMNAPGYVRGWEN